jgi:hypothetical protein
MRVYDIYWDQEHYATLSIDEDGQYVWTAAPTWYGFALDRRHQQTIERDITLNPVVRTFYYMGYTIRQRDME